MRTFFTIYAGAGTSDARGRFELDNLDPSLESHSLFARLSGYVEGRAEVKTGHKAPGDVVEQDLVLGRGTEVRGSIVGPGGEPVPGATVFFGYSPSAYDRIDAVSDDAGRFAFACVAPGEQTLNVERRGLSGKRVKVTVPKPPETLPDLRVELEKGHFIGGVVTDADGRPWPNVSVAPRLNNEYLDAVRGRSDEQGRFRLDGVPAVGLQLEFYGRGVLRHTVPVAAVDRDDLVVKLERHGRMAGTVVDGKTGRPIERFRIRFGEPRLLPGEGSSGGYSATWLRGGKAFQDPNGVFRIDEGVRIGSVFALEASADGYGPLVDDHVVVARDADPSALVFRLWPGAPIRGLVLSRKDQTPVAGARLKGWTPGRPLMPHEPNDDEGRPIAVSDARGAFTLENVGPGQVSIAAVCEGFIPATHGPITVVAGEPVPAQQVLLDRGVTVTVDVRGADGVPLAGAKVRVHGLGGSREPIEVRSDASGTARLERLAPGRYELVLVEEHGTRSVWAHRRNLEVGSDDRRVELSAKGGDATLVLVLEGADPLPAGLLAMIAAKRRSSAPAEVKDGEFTGRGALVDRARLTLCFLPAQELVVFVHGGPWNGRVEVTTQAGASVEARIALKKVEVPGRR